MIYDPSLGINAINCIVYISYIFSELRRKQ